MCGLGELGWRPGGRDAFAGPVGQRGPPGQSMLHPRKETGCGIPV